MPTSSKSSSPQPVAITVSQMAARLGLSRRRFYELVVAGKFPPPTYLLESRRPVYLRDGQEECLAVRTTGIGFDGLPILFNERRGAAMPRAARSGPVRRAHVRPAHDEGASVLVEQLALLGVVTDVESVRQATEEMFPEGLGGVNEGHLVRTLLRRFRCSRMPPT